MKGSTKQVGILLAVLIIPAFFFVLFQASFKNYYQLPYLGKEETKEKIYKIPNVGIKAYQMVEPLPLPEPKTIWVVGYDKESTQLSDSLYNNFTRLSQKTDLVQLLNKQLPTYQISYLLLGKQIPSLHKHVLVASGQGILTEKLLLEKSGDMVLLDNEGYIRGKYKLLNKQDLLDDDELERLVTEIKVLIEIIANPRK